MILALIAFVFNADICNLFYPLNTEEHINNWWDLKCDIYGICIALVFQASVIGEKDNRVRLVLDICTGLALSNVIDRWLFDVREFRYGDVLMIAITLGFALKDTTMPENEILKTIINQQSDTLKELKEMNKKYYQLAEDFSNYQNSQDKHNISYSFLEFKMSDCCFPISFSGIVLSF